MYRFLTAAILLVASYDCFAKEWNGITPLVSTRADVEKILGQGKHLDSETTDYKAEEYRVSINYSLGKCGERAGGKWNVSAGTVISIVVTPRKKVFIEDAVENMTNFEKLPGDRDLPGNFYYLNETDGLSLEVYTTSVANKAVVYRLFYFPAAKEKHLKC